SYFGVVFVGLPLAVITGLAMSPAINAAYPFLTGMFGGYQSARTVHFFAFVILIIFLLVHVLMIIASGFKRQMRGMTLRGKHENYRADTPPQNDDHWLVLGWRTAFDWLL